MDVPNAGPHELAPAWLVAQVVGLGPIAGRLILGIGGQMRRDGGHLVQIGVA